MKEIKPDELFVNLTSFLKDKGIELTDGSYSQRIRQSCELLADAVNLTQAGLAKARAGIDEKLDRMRQIIHEKTAPKSPSPRKKTPGASARPKAGAKRPSTTGRRPGATKTAARKSPRAR
jgi:hypothetical protein